MALFKRIQFLYLEIQWKPRAQVVGRFPNTVVYTWTGQSFGIHLALQAIQTTYLTGKVDGVPHHHGVVWEDGGGEVGSGVQNLRIHLAF
jgi:hypothetical protein